MTLAPETQGAIENVLRQRLKSANIEAVKLREERDHDGDAVLRIHVVISTYSDLDPHELKDLPRHTLAELDRMGIERFPMYTFLHPEDAQELGLGLN